MQTKAQIEAEVRAEYEEQAHKASDEELQAWSHRIAGETQLAAQRRASAKAEYQKLTAARNTSRAEHRRFGTKETSMAWRAAVASADEGQHLQRIEHESYLYSQALASLLAHLLRQRRLTEVGGPNSAPETSAPPELCPYCQHSYTVRDGAAPDLDADGNSRRYRRCQCRVMTPPCRNCPKCKGDDTLMAADMDQRTDLCRNTLQCEICACECPGVGKWVEGDEASRANFQERTAKRHSELSNLLKVSWSEAGESTEWTDTCHRGASASSGVQGMSRLPVDIRNQLDAIAAAETLLRQDYTAGIDSYHQHTRGTRRKRHRSAERSTTHNHRCEHTHDECTSSCCSAVCIT